MPHWIASKGPFAAALTALIYLISASANAADWTVGDLIAAMREIRNEPMPGVRDHKAGQLRTIVRGIVSAGAVDQIPQSTIGDLETLLSDPSTRLSACWALAELGPRARQAIPAIQESLSKMESTDAADAPFPPPVPSSDGMRRCLRIIQQG